MPNTVINHNGNRSLKCALLITLSSFCHNTPAYAITGADTFTPITFASPPPGVVILSAGGNIADSGSAGSYKAGALNPQLFISAIPGLGNIAKIQSEQITSFGSQKMNNSIMLRLAKHINDLAERNDVQGIVITHGTATLEETAFFLNTVINTRNPVVLVGSMRPATAISADGPANLPEAVKTAYVKDSVNRAVLVVMNETVQSPLWVTKSDTTSVQTFASPLAGPVGYVDPQQLRFFRPATGPEEPRLKLPVSDILPRVEIIYAHSNMDDLQIRHAIQNNVKGIVLAGVGDGNASAAVLAALKEAAHDGLIVVRACRGWNAMVKRNVEIDDDASRFVVSPGLNPQKSRILIQILIADSITLPEKVQKSFNTVLHYQRVGNQY